MKRHGRLSRAVLYQLGAGAALSAALFGLVQTQRYVDRLKADQRYIVTIGEKASAMEQATRAMATRRTDAFKSVPAGYENKSHREIALAALEKVRAMVPGARITVENFKTEKEELVLPVKIAFSSDEYGTGVKKVAAIEKLKFPYFSAETVAVKKNDDKTGLEWELEGEFRMPAEKAGFPALEAQR